MTEQAVTVPTNAVVTLNVAMANGTTIYNSDAASAIWVSTNPGLIPGVGMRIGPKGSLEWTSGNTACYAIVDTGVTTPVAITVSDNVSQLVNPVDIGVAVATQLLASGVPNVLVGGPVVSTTLPSEFGADVSKYASISLAFNITGDTLISITFGQGNNIYWAKNYTTAGSGILYLTLPIFGPNIFISTLGGALNVLSAYGSNRSIDNPYVSNQSICFTTAPSQAWTTNITPMAGQLITNGGNHTVLLETTSNAVGILWAHVWDDSANHFGDVMIMDTSIAHQNVTSTTILTAYNNVTLPPGIISFSWQGKTAATYQVVLKVMPGT